MLVGVVCSYAFSAVTLLSVYNPMCDLIRASPRLCSLLQRKIILASDTGQWKQRLLYHRNVVQFV